MNKKEVRCARMNESYVHIEHPSGLTLLLCPMPQFGSSYAMFGTDYGSVDTAFRLAGEKEFFHIPDGTAHFLEHKMFESEKGDAFADYARTGASANAFTSFDKTCYLFSCADHFKESLEILLGFVTDPYFTPETVDKEQGIIGQEIRMYDDSADWRVMFNLLDALYVNHPIKIDIAGTTETIAQITAEGLHHIYRSFYNLHNMVLAIAGNFRVEDVLEVADKVLRPSEKLEVERLEVEEPYEVSRRRVEQRFPIASPMFCIGFKEKPGDKRENAVNSILDEVLNEILVGEASPLYRRLYDEGLINTTFGSESLSGRDYMASMYSGESRDPDKVYEAICDEIERVKREGIDDEAFYRNQRAAWGRYIRMLNRVDSTAQVLMNTWFSDMGLYELLDVVAEMKKEDLEKRLRENFNREQSAISVVLPEA
ncbi:MAG: pitrilysin family protein [Oscillospiraceae bacterium]|nr:pitrilysin family protein [Oscillospiraceae bacterium]